MEEKEIWKFIPGFRKKYRVSNFGNVYSSFKNGRILKPGVNEDDYFQVSLQDKSVVRTKLVHLLVMISFVGERPLNMVINHKDGNVQNNRLDNLEYTSKRENVTHGKIKLLKTSKYTGVYFNDKMKKKWCACIYFEGKTIGLGSFYTEEEAAKCYQQFLIENGIINKYSIAI